MPHGHSKLKKTPPALGERRQEGFVYILCQIRRVPSGWAATCPASMR